MAHECVECGMHCCCDCDDTGGLPQPRDCRCLMQHFDDDQNPEHCSACGARYPDECDCEERANEAAVQEREAWERERKWHQ